MVLVDTSVWIRFLNKRQPLATELDRLLERDEVMGHALVYGELLIGDRGGRANLLADYSAMFAAAVLPHDDVVTFVNSRRLRGRGIGWTDAHLLASAVVERARLWTADAQLASLAAEVGVG